MQEFECESLQLAVVIQGEEDNYYCVKVELFSPNDYFFLYEHLCELGDYANMQFAQSLTPDFPEYLTMLIKLFNQGISSPKTTKLQLQMNKDNTGDLFFQQVMEYEVDPKRAKDEDEEEKSKC